jgi:hypothetical protein
LGGPVKLKKKKNFFLEVFFFVKKNNFLSYAGAWVISFYGFAIITPGCFATPTKGGPPKLENRKNKNTSSIYGDNRTALFLFFLLY